MHDVSPEGAAGAFVAIVLGAIRLAGLVIERSNARRLKSMQSIPPSEMRPTVSGDDLHRRVAALERSEVEELRVRVAVLEGELADARGIARDYARTAAALSAERERADQAEAHSRALRAELEQLRREISGGHTGLAVRSDDHAGLSDPDATPPEGHRASRRRQPA